MKDPSPRSRALAALLAALVLIGVVVATNGTGRSRRSTPQTPNEQVTNVIYDGLVDSMRKGNVRRYLACFGQPLRGQLESSLQSDGKGAFTNAFRRQMERSTGVAVTGVQVAGDEASARLEWVYKEDSDIQTVNLSRTGGRWLISAMENVKRSKLPIPYGTEVIPGLTSGQAPPEAPQ